jgi:hypothetical protein
LGFPHSPVSPRSLLSICSPPESHAAKARPQALARRPRAERGLAGRKAPTHPEELCGTPFSVWSRPVGMPRHGFALRLLRVLVDHQRTIPLRKRPKLQRASHQLVRSVSHPPHAVAIRIMGRIILADSLPPLFLSPRSTRDRSTLDCFLSSADRRNRSLSGLSLTQPSSLVR